MAFVGVLAEFVFVEADDPAGSFSIDIQIPSSSVVGVSSINEILTQPEGFDNLQIVSAEIAGNGTASPSLSFTGQRDRRMPGDPVVVQDDATRITCSLQVNTSGPCEVTASFSISIFQ